MATDAVQPRLRAAGHRVRPVSRSMERGFYAGMVILLCVIIVYGFSRTYFFAGMVLAPLPNLLIHIHGASFTLWMVLLLVQSAFVSAGRVAWHRALGTIAFCLPPLMVVLGILAALDAFRRGMRIGPFDPTVSLAIPLIGMASFAPVVYAAWRARRRQDAHKRLVLYSTVGLTQAAFGRMPFSHLATVTAFAGLFLLMIGWDLYSLHRVHRSSMWAAPLTFIMAQLQVPIGMTPLWHHFAGFLAKHVAPHV